MNDEEEVVVSQEQQEQPQEEQQQKQSISRPKSLSEQVDNVREGMETVGKTAENFGKGEEKVADLLDGGKKGTKAASNVGTATSSAAEKGAGTAKKAAEAKEKAAKAAGETAKAGKAAAQGGKAASKGTQAAGEGMSQAGNSPYTSGLKAAGETVKAVGKTGEAVATTGEAAASTGEAAAKAAEEAAKAERAAAAGAEAAAKTANAGNKAANKAGDNSLSDKLRSRGKLHQEWGKKVQEKAKNFDSDKFFDDAFSKLGKGGQKLGQVLKGLAKLFDPKTIAVITLLVITLGTLLVSYILSPLFFMNLVQNSITDPDKVEKVNNFVAGLGFKDSEKAFYDEIDYLNNKYKPDGKDQIDFTYIMAALYYPDIFGIDASKYYKAGSNFSKCNGDKECNTIQIGSNLAKIYLRTYIEETKSTVGDDGLTYSANKLYRLRELAKHQFTSDDETEATLEDYIKYCVEEMGNETANILENLPLLIFYIYSFNDPLAANTIKAIRDAKILEDIVYVLYGYENMDSFELYLKNGKYDEIKAELGNLLEAFCNCFFRVKSISFSYDEESIEDRYNNFDPGDGSGGRGGLSLLSGIKVTFYGYRYNEEAFEKYLVEEYIPKMPEYAPFVKNKKGEVDQEKVKKVANDIYQIRNIFESLYKHDETAEEYGKCIGNINLDLLTELVPPIDLQIGQSLTFSGANNYGLYRGMMHNGVDLEEDSTGTKAGDNVYSIYDGRVIQSTLDNSYLDKTAKGGWLVIEYTVQYNDETVQTKGIISDTFKNKLSTITAYYGGLDPNDLKLKSGDLVNKGDVIGHVGDATASENGEKASLHFGVFDNKTRLFLNPVNMFVTCRGIATSCKSDSKEGTKMDIPSSVLSMKQVNYTVTFYNENGFITNNCSKGCVGKGTNQEKVHNLWLKDGKRFKNSIAVINVNGTDRYLTAVTEKFGEPGDLLYAKLENGDTIPLIMADQKSYKDTGVKNEELCKSDLATDPGCWGHIDGGLSVIEFEFDYSEYRKSGIQNPTRFGLEWDKSQKVVSISNCGSVFDN